MVLIMPFVCCPILVLEYTKDAHERFEKIPLNSTFWKAIERVERD